MYVKFNPRWLPFPNTSTPITDKALDHIEQGITDVDVTRPGTPAEVELSSRLSATAGSAEGLVQAERAAREAAVTAEATARVAAIEAETAARKTAIIGESDARIAALALKANADAVYTKAQVDAAVSPKANSADVYTKAQSDTALGLKADKTAVYTKAETYTRTETGTQITTAITASRPPLYGTGFPNGVVAAPVGTLYSDTAVTNGASLWQKVSGTGNTGWEVVRGRTGGREVKHLISGVKLAVRAQIERTPDLLHYRFVLDLELTQTGLIEIMTPALLPFEWRPIAFEIVEIMGVNGAIRQMTVDGDGAMSIKPGPAMERAHVMVSIPTPRPYPSTLIGTN